MAIAGDRGFSASGLVAIGLAGAALLASAGSGAPAGRTAVPVSPANDASEGGSISADGRFVAFSSVASNLVAADTNTGCVDDLGNRFNCPDVFVRDLQAGTTSRLSVSSSGARADDWSGVGSISAAGRFVAFGSEAPNLVAGDTNRRSDVFVRDRVAQTTTLVSVGRR